MKKMFRKSTAILSSALIASVLAVPSMTAFAYKDYAKTITPADSTSFKITKDIVLFNENGSDIYEPNVTYTYTVAPAANTTEPTITVTDKNGTSETTDDEAITVKVHNGIAGGVTLTGNNGSAPGASANIVFGTDNENKYNTLTEGTVAKLTTIADEIADEELTITINPSVIYGTGTTHNPAGVYRYVITDTTADETLTAAGITRNSAYTETYYLDVYTKSKIDSTSGAVTGLQVYGYVLFKSSSTEGASHSFNETKAGATDTPTDTNDVKVSGFDVESEAAEGTPTGTPTGSDDKDTEVISDQYHTYNATVKKLVDGGDTTHEFPFKVDLTNATVKSQADFYYTQSGANEATTAALSSSGAWTFGDASGTTLALKDKETISIVGLPKGTKIMVTEKNDTSDMYSASAKNGDTALTLSRKELAPNDATNLSAVISLDSTNTDVDNIVFTNKLTEISPTGVLFTVAPFAALAGVGTLFAGLFIKNKKREDSDEMI